jgi:hypothetical protein
VHDALGVHVDDEERENGTEPYVVDLKEIAGPDRVVSQERAPGLSATRSCGPHAAHAPLNRSLRDSDPELQEFASDALGSPQPVVLGHRSNERDRLRRKPRLRGFARRLPAPPEPEPLAVPTQDGLWFYEQNRVPPARQEPGEEHQQPAFMCRDLRTPGRSRQDDELLAQQGVLGDELGA